MTDRELLELAAKAIGMEYLQYVEESYPNRAGLLHGNPDGQLFVWNPLMDDGEAFRLAVRSGVMRGRGFEDAYTAMYAVGQLPSDPCAAYRRAIVSAVAQAGRRYSRG